MTLGSHQRVLGKSQVHITPKRIIEALGPFDCDPAAADSSKTEAALLDELHGRQRGDLTLLAARWIPAASN